MTSERLNFLLTIDIMIHVLELLWRKLTFSPLQHILRCFLTFHVRKYVVLCLYIQGGKKKKKEKVKLPLF